MKLQREDPSYHYEGYTDVDEIYQPREEEMDDCEHVPSLPNKKKPKRNGPSRRSHHEEEIVSFHACVPSNDELSNPSDVNNGDYDSVVQRNILLCGKRKRRPKKKEEHDLV